MLIFLYNDFFKKFISHRNEKNTHTDILMNKPVYLHLSIIRNKENSNV